MRSGISIAHDAGLRQVADTPGLTAAEFRRIARNGFGDPGNAYAHSMAWFRDHLYVGTTRHNLAQRGVVVGIERGRGAHPLNIRVWPVELPDTFHGVFELDLRAQIWRYDPKADAWTQVYTSSMFRTPHGFEVPLSLGYRALTPFQGRSDPCPALYVPTWATHHSPATRLLRSVDGVHFEVISEAGLGMGDEFRGARAMAAFKGRLFIAPAMGRKQAQPNTADTMSILVSDDPVNGGWEQACPPHFGDRGNRSVFAMSTFNSYLYAGTLNVADGFQLWKTDGQGAPPLRWTKVLTCGAYRGKLNQAVFTMFPFKDHLYVGTGIQGGGFDREFGVGPAAPEVLRVARDDSWELIVGEPRYAPDGLRTPLSGLRPGFGNPASCYIWAMADHDGWLYVSSAAWGPFVQFHDWSKWPKALAKLIDPETFERYMQESGGPSLWRTRDGVAWVPVSRDGLGNPYTVGIRRMVSTPYGLFAGSANAFGPKVAVKRAGGWVYESNPEGGLEIFLAKRHRPGTDAADSQEVHLSRRHPEPAPSSHAGRRRSAELDELLSEFYDRSDFRLIGFWRPGITDAKSACENLVDELVSFTCPLPMFEPPHPPSDTEMQRWHRRRASAQTTDHAERANVKLTERVLDLCCGRGATTRRLLRHFAPAAITGVATNRQNLAACRAAAPEVTFRLATRHRLDLPAASFDCVVCAEGLAAPDREPWLGEVLRVLRHGGRMVIADVLHGDASRRHRRGDRSAPVTDPAGYQQLLQRLGFEGIQVVDATAECWERFWQHAAQYVEANRLCERFEQHTREEMVSYLTGQRATVRYYVLASATRPPHQTPGLGDDWSGPEQRP